MNLQELESFLLSGYKESTAMKLPSEEVFFTKSSDLIHHKDSVLDMIIGKMDEYGMKGLPRLVKYAIILAVLFLPLVLLLVCISLMKEPNANVFEEEKIRRKRN